MQALNTDTGGDASGRFFGDLDVWRRIRGFEDFVRRSPAAEGVFRHLVAEAGRAADFHIDSAGTHAYHVGNSPDRRAQETAQRRGIDLSDLVLVFFDARHPEPGAMKDTLDHLVANTVNRPDSNKFLYILNQLDNTAREDNPEEVVAAWQRALAQHGLTAGRFYRIYARDAALPIQDEKVLERMERKRDEDLADIEALGED